MIGLSSSTGKTLLGIDHLKQSIRDILTTRIGTRVMRRDYGSNLPNLLDRPITPSLASDIYAATADALSRWEPRFSLSKIAIVEAKAGWVMLELTGIYLPDSSPIIIKDLQVSR